MNPSVLFAIVTRPQPRSLNALFFGGGLLLLLTSVSSAGVIVEANFNGVSGLDAADSTRTVTSIRTLNPEQLPPGTREAADPDRPSAMNVRRGDNTINTRVAVGFGFQPANAENKFLVLGDDSGDIGGEPSDGFFMVRIPVPRNGLAGATAIRVQFDWAFQGIDGDPDHDSFRASIRGANAPATYELMTVLSTKLTSAKSFAADVPIGSLPAGDLSLDFGLLENSAVSTNTAVGIDNVKVSTVPEPAGMVLLAMGLLRLLRRRR